jgi:hypothetical protein
MVPIFLQNPIPVGSPPDFTGQQLERELDIAVCLIKQLAERLRVAAGPEALELQLNRFLDACDPVAQGAAIRRLDELVCQKQQTEAVRLFRELFGATWDQAFDWYVSWASCDHAKKLRWLQAGELHKLAAAFAPVHSE